MAEAVWIDTSGFYALMVSQDEVHESAKLHYQEMLHGRQIWYLSDYIIDEMVGLLRARKAHALVPPFFKHVNDSKLLRVEWMTPLVFAETGKYLLKHHDKTYSFTDCSSFVFMKRLGIQQALTKDKHFEQAGFRGLLCSSP